MSTRVGREYNHLEDLVFIQGTQGVHRACSVIENILDGKENINIKFDGNPTIYWGRDSYGKFLMVNKNAWGRSAAYNTQTLSDFILSTGNQENWRQRFAQEMCTVFEYLEHATPDDVRGYYYGDLLYHPGNPCERTHRGYQFTPNKVTYTVEPEGHLGQRITGSRVGVVVHQKHDDFGSKLGHHVTDSFNNFDQSVSVFEPVNVNPEVVVDSVLLQNLIEITNCYSTDIDGFLEEKTGLMDIRQILYTYVNQMSKQDRLSDLEHGFFSWLEQSKVSVSKQKRIHQRHSEFPHALHTIMSLVLKIMHVKNSVIQQLDDSVQGIDFSINNVTGGEGYIAGNSKIKLVPRHLWKPD